jgi:hypothetical protein
MTQNNLGSALSTVGERENGTARLEEAMSAYHEALKEHSGAGAARLGDDAIAGKLYFLLSESSVRNPAHSRLTLEYVSTGSSKVPKVTAFEACDAVHQLPKLEKLICSVTTMHSSRRDTYSLTRMRLPEAPPRLAH